MSPRTIAAASLIALSAGVLFLAPAHAASKVDTDADGTIDMNEAHAAAGKKFDTLDTRKAGKLTGKQVSPISRAMSEMARHDKDHTIDRDEYMAGVDAAFKEADPKGSGVLDAKALKTKAGRQFLKLVE